MATAFDMFGQSFEKRSAARTSVSLPASVCSRGATYSARILDIGTGGAMMLVPAAIPIGARLVIGSGPMTMHGTVAWSDGDRCGVRFRHRIDQQTLEQQVARSHAVDLRRTLRVLVTAAADA